MNEKKTEPEYNLILVLVSSFLFFFLYCVYVSEILLLFELKEWDNGSGTFNLVTKILVIELSLEMCFPEFSCIQW